jgi:hypothetical protein
MRDERTDELVRGLLELVAEWDHTEVHEDHRSGLRLAAAQVRELLREGGFKPSTPIGT